MSELLRLAELVKEKNEVELGISSIIGRPALIGHTGEYIASEIFNIRLVDSASNKGFDGYFTKGMLTGKSVNVKWYTKRECFLDINPLGLPDFYLVMTGPHRNATSSRGTTLPWKISNVYLFNSIWLIDHLNQRKIKVGIATSVHSKLWEDAEVFPQNENRDLILTKEQHDNLLLFG